MSAKLEISLKYANSAPVSLNYMTPEALDSFMAVIASLKAIVTSIGIDDEVTFTIKEGSASCAVQAQPDTMHRVYQEMDYAIRGESYHKAVTSNLRIIQDQLKRDGFVYDFLYTGDSQGIVELHNRLRNSKKITIKRERKPIEYKVVIKSGVLNQIGGKDPNYHFDYGGGDKITIECSKNEAMTINQYLYQSVTSMLICKEWTDGSKPNEFTHKLIVDERHANSIKRFIDQYNAEEEIVEKLTSLHQFIDMSFEEPETGFEVLKSLMIGFNDRNLHLSELKTLLVISKPFKDVNAIKDVRQTLFDTYKIIRG